MWRTGHRSLLVFFTCLAFQSSFAADDRDIPTLKIRAAQGDATARTTLGEMYLNGTGVPADPAKGFAYLLCAAPGNSHASLLVAKCYQDGTFVQPSVTRAIAWGLYAASLGANDEATNFVASLKNRIKNDDYDKGEKLFQALPRFLDGHFQTTDLTSTLANGKSSLIPCEFYLNGILIPIPTKDKRPAFLLFDTGATIPILADTFASRMNIRGNDYFPALGLGADPQLGSITNGIAFSLPGLTFRNARWAILPDLTLDAAYGRPVVGILGMDLLNDFVIHINPLAQTVEFIKPDAFKPPTDAVSLPLGMSYHGPMVSATIKTARGEATGRFLIDTGNNSTFSLGKAFQDAHPELEFKKIAVSGASGVGGVSLIAKAICPELDLGEITIANATVDLDQAAQGAQATVDGRIGNEIWRRFDLTLDLPGKRLYLKKNANFSAPFSYTTAGMLVQASGENYETLTVRQMLPGSAGEKVGFQKGDILIALPELKGKPLTIANVYPILHREGTWHFTVRRGAEKIPITLVLSAPDPAK